MSRSPTALSTWGLAIAAALEARGHSSRSLFEQAGLDYGALGTPNARYSVNATTRLWKLAVAATHDPCFGIEVARHAQPAHFHALGFSLAASGSLGEAFERIVRFFRIVTDAAEMRLESGAEEVRFVADPAELPAPPADEAVDAFMAVAVRLARALHSRTYNPLCVELKRRAPADCAPFARFFRVQPSFGRASNVLVFDRESFDSRLRTGNAELARVNDAIVSEHLDRLEREHIILRLRKVLIEHLPYGEPAQEDMARLLGLSLRSLQRRLLEQQTTYRQVLDDTRYELARGYIQDPEYSMTEIAYLLGFETASSFSRAFARWSGQAPLAFRKRLFVSG